MANTAVTSDDLYSLLVLIIAIFQEKSMFKIAKKRKCQRQIIYNYPSKRLTQMVDPNFQFFPGEHASGPWPARMGRLWRIFIRTSLHKLLDPPQKRVHVCIHEHK